MENEKINNNSTNIIINNNNSINLNKNNNNFNIISTIKFHKEIVYCLKILNDNRIASSSYDSSINIFTLIELKLLISIKSIKLPILYIDQLKDNTLICCSSDSKIYLIKLLNNNMYEIVQELINHTKWVNKVIEINNMNLISCSFDNKIKIWKKNNNNNLYFNSDEIKFKEHIFDIIEISNNKIISSHNVNILNVIDINKKTIINKLKVEDKSNWNNNLCLINKNILIFAANKYIHLINIIEMKILFFILIENKIGSIISFYNNNNNNNNNDNIFYTGDKKGNLIQWKIINEKIVLNYYKNVHTNWINNIKIDKYNRIITASEDGLIKIIEII